jgi:hydroxymethylpyrimidine/phosphomethylpyrimidine kinase
LAGSQQGLSPNAPGRLLHSARMNTIPRILCIGGHDPTGGAGIQADIETVTALGGRALALVTALTAQDTHDIKSTLPVPADFFARQADTLLRDIQPDAIKIGLIGSTALLPEIHRLLGTFQGPIVVDPVLAAGGGFELGDDLTGPAGGALLSMATLVTPNRAEARRLSGCDDIEAAAGALLRAGVGALLITGADEARGEFVINELFTVGDRPVRYEWPRLAQRYHGSGCTLASACATRLAFGDDLSKAVVEAQEFTWQALAQATQVGSGQWLPERRS